MMEVSRDTKPRSLRNVPGWFDVWRRSPGMWGYALNRLSAIGLTIYLFIHLVSLSKLAQGPAAYAGFLTFIKSPIFTAGELLVVVGSLIHGLNGLRIAVTSFGIAVPYHKQIFFVLLVIAIAVSAVFGIRMFSVR